MSSPTKTTAKKVQLFINSDEELCDPLVKFIQTWDDGGSKPLGCEVEILSVLENPVDVVRYQLFYTPAVVIDGEVAGTNVRTVEQLESLLPSG